jgi:transcription antitermination protein NusB
MTLRRKSREYALQMLFQWGIHHQPAARIEQLFWKTARAAESTRRFANELFEGAVTQAESNDKLVEQFSKNWRLERMAEVDRGILRLAMYELRSGTAPLKVVIDEAIELAKRFSTAESAPFLNGILDAAAKSLEKV